MSNKIEEVSLSVTPLVGFQVSTIDPHHLRDALLVDCKNIVPVKTQEEASAVLALAGQAKGLSKRVRALGKLAREPYNSAAKSVIQVENEFCDPLDAAAEHAEKIAADYAVAEQKRIDAERAETARLAKIEADKLAELERQRIKAEQEAAAAAEQHRLNLERLERDRIAAEQAAADAKGKAAKAKAQAETERLEREQAEAVRIADVLRGKAQAEAEELRKQQERAELAAEFSQESAAAASEVQIAKPTGGSIRTGWKIEVANLDELYRAFPRCVTLKANLLEIKDTIRDLERAAEKEGVENFTPVIPGVKLTEETKISARSISPGLALK